MLYRVIILTVVIHHLLSRRVGIDFFENCTYFYYPIMHGVTITKHIIAIEKVKFLQFFFHRCRVYYFYFVEWQSIFFISRLEGKYFSNEKRIANEYTVVNL